MTQLFHNRPARKRVEGLTRSVLNVICKQWPVNPFEVATSLGENGNNKTLSSKYLYHFRRLKDLGLIEMKRTGNTYIAWPSDIEKLRLIHEMLKV